jgi:hypothetical protein
MEPVKPGIDCARLQREAMFVALPRNVDTMLPRANLARVEPNRSGSLSRGKGISVCCALSVETVLWCSGTEEQRRSTAALRCWTRTPLLTHKETKEFAAHELPRAIDTLLKSVYNLIRQSLVHFQAAGIVQHNCNLIHDTRPLWERIMLSKAKCVTRREVNRCESLFRCRIVISVWIFFKLRSTSLYLFVNIVFSVRFDVLTACSPLEINGRFGGICRLHFQARRIRPSKGQPEAGSKQTAYSLTLKMEAKFSSETSVDFQWSTQRYIPEARTLHCTLYFNTYTCKL